MHGPPLPQAKQPLPFQILINIKNKGTCLQVITLGIIKNVLEIRDEETAPKLHPKDILLLAIWAGQRLTCLGPVHAPTLTCPSFTSTAHSISSPCPFLISFPLFYCRQVHVLPREMLGISTFGLSMWLLKWFPVQMVDRLLLLVASLMLGDTSRFGLERPQVGPLELKSLSGKTPVLDVGTLAKIKSGDIKVHSNASWVTDYSPPCTSFPFTHHPRDFSFLHHRSALR